MESSDRRKLNGRKSRTFFCLSGKTQTSMTSVEKRVLEVKNTDYYSVNTFKYVYFFGEEVMYDAPVPKNSVLYSMHTSLEEKQKSILAWSSDALMSLMPVVNEFYRPAMKKYDDFYCCVYSDDHCGDIQWFNGDTPVDAAFEMILWLIEMNLIKHS